MGKKFDLKSLESSLRQAYIDFKYEDSEKTRVSFFEATKDLSFAIVSISDWIDKAEFDPDEIAYEYAIYLFERVITDKFKPKFDEKSFPWTSYVKLNIKHIVHGEIKKSERWKDVLSDFQFFIDNEPHYLDSTIELQKPLIDEFYKKEISDQIFKSLNLFYTKEEISRMLPLAMEVISSSSGYNSKMPEDLHCFCLTLISLSKRLCSAESESNPRSKDMKKLLKSSLRSSVFLSTITNSDFFPRELLLSLDIDSLFRLVRVCGGQTIRIPRPQELDSLLCAVVALSKMIDEGKEANKSISDAKESFDLILTRKINLKGLVAKLADTFSIFNEDPETEPMVSVLIDSIKSLSDTIDGQVYEESELSQTIENFEKTLPKLSEVGYG